MAGGNTVQDYINSHLVDSNVWSILPGGLLNVTLIPKFSIFGYEFSKGLHAIMLLIGSLILFLLFGVLYKKNSKVAPKGLTNLLEIWVLFVRDEICVAYLGDRDGRKLAPFFLTFFFLIWTLNLMGLFPIFSTATSNLSVTAGLSLSVLTLMVLLGVGKHGIFGFLKIFAPSGVPAPVLLLLFPIELMGLFIKPFALTIRLFANLLAGHIVVLSIVGLIVTFGIFGLPALFLGLFIYALELLVAFIQAYIFTMLSAMFLGDILHPHH